MILPPFFGYPVSYKDREIYRLFHSYAAQDLLTYTDPTQIVLLSYVSQDILTYSELPNIMNVSYVSQDILTYSYPIPIMNFSYAAVDVLSYDPPPAEPNAPIILVINDGDSCVFAYWAIPYNNRTPITDYTISYSTGDYSSWTLYDDGISTSTGVTVTGLINNISYQLKIAAVNAVGTGEYSYSEYVTPSGGDSSYQKMMLYLPLDHDTIDQSCYAHNVQEVIPQLLSLDLTTDYYKYGNASLYLDGQLAGTESLDYPHLIVGSGENFNWNFSHDFTIEMFIKPQVSVATDTLLCIQSNDMWNNSKIKLYRDNNKLHFDFILDYYDTNEGQYYASSGNLVINNTSFPTGSWTHIAACRSNDVMKMYINGINTSNIIFSSLTNPYVSGMIMTVGAESYSNWGSPPRYSINGFAGYIDQVIVSKSAKYRSNFIVSEYTTLKDCGPTPTATPTPTPTETPTPTATPTSAPGGVECCGNISLSGPGIPVPGLYTRGATSWGNSSLGGFHYAYMSEDGYILYVEDIINFTWSIGIILNGAPSFNGCPITGTHPTTAGSTVTIDCGL